MPHTLGFPPETMGLFAFFVGLFFWLDLRNHADGHEVSLRDAGIWSAIWVAVSFVWYGFLWWHHGSEFANLFLAGYVLEKSLSVDNLMVFVLIFTAFKISGPLQHRILHWGIVGALVFRLIFIGIGTGLLSLTPYMLFIFGAVVLWSAWQMLVKKDEDEDNIPDYYEFWIVKLINKIWPVTPTLVGNQFFVKSPNASGVSVWHVTPAFICMGIIEASDIIFAFDSVPTVIAVARQPLIVYSSITFAMLGLRSLYFLLAAANQELEYLEKAVIALLFYIGAKLIFEGVQENFHVDIFHISPGLNVAIVLGVLGVGVGASILKR